MIELKAKPECCEEASLASTKLVYPYGMPPDGMNVLWRCEARRYSVVIDAEAERFGVTDPQLEVRWHEVKRRTPKGAWLEDRFVLLTARKRYACNTVQEAIDSFVARKKRQIEILTGKLQRAKADLNLATNRMKGID